MAATGISVKGCPLISIIILSLLSSCARTPEASLSEPSRVIAAVPFFPQQAFQCGPASLAGVLSYWGVDITPEEIATDIYSQSARGTLNVDMILYAEKRGLEAHHYRGSLEDLRRRIDSGYPLIVLVDSGFWVYEQNHFMVVVGYSQGGIIANSGKEQHRSIPLGGFLKSWEKANFWTLLVLPGQGGTD